MMKKFKQNDNNYAIAYYRFSSHAQNEASIEQQREQAMRYAKEHGLIIIKEYSDKAITGTTDERPGFQQMLAEVGKLEKRQGTLLLCLQKSQKAQLDTLTEILVGFSVEEALIIYEN